MRGTKRPCNLESDDSENEAVIFQKRRKLVVASDVVAGPVSPDTRVLHPEDCNRVQLDLAASQNAAFVDQNTEFDLASTFLERTDSVELYVQIPVEKQAARHQTQPSVNPSPSDSVFSDTAVETAASSSTSLGIHRERQEPDACFGMVRPPLPTL
jgi:hypothetical protein